MSSDDLDLNVKPSADVNGWDAQKQRTIDAWYEFSKRQLFIYDIAYAHYTKKHNVIGVLLIVFSGLITLLGAATFLLGVNSSSSTQTTNTTSTLPVTVEGWVAVSFALAVTVLGAITTGLSSVDKLMGWEEARTSVYAYTKKIIEISSALYIQTTLPYANRTEGNEFIKDYAKKMDSTTSKAPNIGTSLYMRGASLYDERLKVPKDAHTEFCTQRIMIRDDIV